MGILNKKVKISTESPTYIEAFDEADGTGDEVTYDELGYKTINVPTKLGKLAARIANLMKSRGGVGNG